LLLSPLPVGVERLREKYICICIEREREREGERGRYGFYIFIYVVYDDDAKAKTLVGLGAVRRCLLLYGNFMFIIF